MASALAALIQPLARVFVIVSSIMRARRPALPAAGSGSCSAKPPGHRGHQVEIGPADRFDRFYGAPALEGSQPGEQHLLLGVEQVVTPVESAAQRLLAVGRSRAPPRNTSSRLPKRSSMACGEYSLLRAAASSAPGAAHPGAHRFPPRGSRFVVENERRVGRPRRWQKRDRLNLREVAQRRSAPRSGSVRAGQCIPARRRCAELPGWSPSPSTEGPPPALGDQRGGGQRARSYREPAGVPGAQEGRQHGRQWFSALSAQSERWRRCVPPAQDR